jgi:hypothetical protein
MGSTLCCRFKVRFVSTLRKYDCGFSLPSHHWQACSRPIQRSQYQDGDKRSFNLMTIYHGDERTACIFAVLYENMFSYPVPNISGH